MGRGSANLPHPQFTLDLCHYPMAGAAYFTAAAARALDHVHTGGFRARDFALEELQDLELTIEMSEQTGSKPTQLLLADGDGALAWLQLFGGEERGSQRHVNLKVAASDADAARALSDRLHDALASDDPPDHLVPMNFWARSPNGPRQMPKLIESPRWEDIARNYAPAARDELERLAAMNQLQSGRLILWQGPPGTGKTYALRALARAWREWCEFHVVIDPDVFFGEDSSYLMDILFQPRNFGSRGSRKASLLILEDAGELVTADARAEAGQALSRLLNVSDGLLGQGLNLCTLITTNEPIERLHPAVRRPGRCLAQVEVPPLDPEAANRWLEGRNGGAPIDEPITLAELFAKTEHADAEGPRG